MNKKDTPQITQTLVSETLIKISHKSSRGKTSISELIEEFHENSILLAMIFFSLPIITPIPYPPGFTTILSIPLIILSIQMIVGSKKIILPNKINQYALKNSTLKLISNKVLPFVLGIEKHLKPRTDFATSIYCKQLVGLFCFIATISIAIPLPLTNAIPALGITVMSLGLLNRDGIAIIIGVFITIIGIFIAISTVLASLVAIKYLFHTLF